VTADAAVIDVGSNSVLLLVVAVEEGGAARAIDEALATTRLGLGLRPGGRLDPDACSRTMAVVVRFTARARELGAEWIWAFATAAIRDAADGDAFARGLRLAAGVPVAVLSGEQEARLAYAAVRGGLALGDDPLLVADVGGRTTELTLGRGDEIVAATSLPLGALALTEAHGDDASALAAAVDRIVGECDLVRRAAALGARLAVSVAPRRRSRRST
jgi:exopolyphosphatase/guanosine-5'-triphosphate,3'-diphosphate pyrophosphatase